MGNAVDVSCGYAGTAACCRHDSKPGCSVMTVDKVMEEIGGGPNMCSTGLGRGEHDCSSNDPAVQESMVNYELLKAARDGRTADVALQLWNGAYLETRRPFAITFDLESVAGHESLGLTPLMYASLGGYTSTCEVLLQAKADVNAKDEDGMQPLHFAASSGNMEACRLLLRFSADPHSEDNAGRPALDHVPPIDIYTRSEQKAWEAIIGPNAPRPEPEQQAPEKTPESRRPPEAGGAAKQHAAKEEEMPSAIKQERQGFGM